MDVLGVDAQHSGTTAVNNRVVTLPPGIQSGHFGIIAVHIPNTSRTLTTPSGWTLAPPGTFLNTTTSRAWCLYRKMDGSESGTTVTLQLNNTSIMEVVAAVLTDLDSDAGLVITSTQDPSSSTDSGTTAVTPDVDGAILVTVFTPRYASIATSGVDTPPAGYTTLVDHDNAVTSGSNGRHGVYIAAKQLAGQNGVSQPSDAGTWLVAATSHNWTFAVAAAAVVLNRSTSDSAPATDTVARALATSRTTGDTAAATDTCVAVVTRARALSDAASATDSVSVSRTLSRSQSDSAPATDTTARSTSRPRSCTDNAPATDTTSRATTRSRSLADTAAATDTTARSTARARALSDSAPATDATSASTGGQLARNLSDSAAATDAVTRSTARARATPDSAPATDVAARTTTRARALSDTATATDTTAAGTTGNLTRSQSDTAAAADSVARRGALPRSASDTATAADTTTRALSQSRTLGDTAPLVDLVTAARTQSRILFELALATDTTSASVAHPTPGPTGRIISSRVMSPVTAAAVVLLRTQGRVHAPNTTGGPITTELAQGVIT